MTDKRIYTLARVAVIVFFSVVVGIQVMMDVPVDDSVLSVLMIGIGFLFGKITNGASVK